MNGPDSTELQEAQRRGDPYLRFSDAQGRERVLSLPGDWDRVTVGRAMGADVALTWDEDASRIHAELVRLADDWVVADDGLSRNGTYVNGERIEGRRRLFDGDELRVGQTVISFHAPFQVGDETRTGTIPPEV